VDRSATLIFPLDTTNPACRLADDSVCGTQGVDNCDQTRCPTRLRTVQSQIETFLASHPSEARYGLAFFPATESDGSTVPLSCQAPTQMAVSPPSSDEPLPLQRSEQALLDAIRNVPTPSGSTPLSGTMAMVAQATPLGSSAAMAGDAVVVITDGLPNCNPNNPNDGISTPTLCRCTVASCASQSLSRIGCLDLDASAAQLTSLRQRGVRTFVMPVGNDALTGEGPSVFHTLAEAGGTVRECLSTASCGSPYTCDPITHLCSGPSLVLGELDRVFPP
jgi:hypothetical protein